MKISPILMSAVALAVLALSAYIVPVHAETVEKKVVVTQKDIPTMNKVRFSDFDTNKDGILSRREVGERIFRSFDRDGNMSIDSHEFEKKSVLTVVPVEKETTLSLDVNDDGQKEVIDYTTDNFMSETGLTHFTTDSPSISPHDFLKTNFKKVDTGRNGYIELKEWKAVYERIYAHKHDNPQLYND